MRTMRRSYDFPNGLWATMCNARLKQAPRAILYALHGACNYAVRSMLQEDGTRAVAGVGFAL